MTNIKTTITRNPMTNITTAIREQLANYVPEIGSGATIYDFSDRSPATVIEVVLWKSGAKAGQIRSVVVQIDRYVRTDSNGMSESQTYDYFRDHSGVFHKCTMKSGWLMCGSSRVGLGHRQRFYDYSF